MDTLNPGDTLTLGGQLDSGSGVFLLTLQADGNLVVSAPPLTVPIWASNTSGQDVVSAIMQTSGAFQLLNSAGTPVFSVPTQPVASSFLVVQDDGNLCIYNQDQTTALWCINSVVVPPPTPANIAQVQSNLQKMQSFNDYVYNQGQSRVNNAYLLLSEQDSDPGLTVGLNILEGAFWAIGSELGPAGNFFASFLSGMVSWWASDTPPSLNETFASLDLRLQETSRQVDLQLATYYTYIDSNWMTSFTYNGTTGRVCDLTSETFPAETDPLFETLAQAALFALDQAVWTYVLKAQFVITQWTPSINLGGDENVPPYVWDENMISINPAYYNTWTWHNKSGCGDQSGWLITEYNLGSGAAGFSDGSLNSASCQYLFIDSVDGYVINPNGLFNRATVFNQLNIRTTTHDVPSGGGGRVAEKVSMGYLRAAATGQTIGQLIQRLGRDAVERQIIERAHQDQVFASDLALRPRQTLERFLDVRIPEVVSVSVIVESPSVFGLVVPAPNQQAEKS